MKRRYWTSSAVRPDGTPLALYICTTPDLVSHDLKQAQRGSFSLVSEGRRKTSLNGKVDDSLYFAVGAFAGHCGNRKQWSGELREIEAAPTQMVPGSVVEQVTHPEHA